MRIGKIVCINLRVNGNVFNADTNYTIAKLTHLKPDTRYFYATVGNDNLSNGGIAIDANGSIVLRISSKTAYASATCLYFSDDI